MIIHPESGSMVSGKLFTDMYGYLCFRIVEMDLPKVIMDALGGVEIPDLFYNVIPPLETTIYPKETMTIEVGFPVDGDIWLFITAEFSKLTSHKEGG